MIEVKGLSKSFNGFKALDNVSITVNKGSVYGLVGPNGAGKSTLLRNILGVYKPDSGCVLIDNEPVFDNKEVKRKMASIPDDWFYYNLSTVKDMHDFYKGIYDDFDEDRYKELGELFEIDQKRNIRHLSKGMIKQVAFWLSISTRPEYLILDEPVDGLDPVMRKKVWSALMQDVTERNMTVLVSSHNLRELEDVCDSVGMLEKGKVVIERSLTDLQDNMVKLQVVFEGEGLPEGLPIVHASNIGRMYTIILRMNSKDALERVGMYKPLVMEALPLTLEEIFIYEMGGKGNE